MADNIFCNRFNNFYIKLIFQTNQIDTDVFHINRNKRSKTRDALASFVNGLSISDMDSVRGQLGMLSLLSIQTDEISRTCEVIIKKLFKC